MPAPFPGPREACNAAPVRFGPNVKDPNMLAIIETRIRGKDWNTNQQSLTGLRRVK